MSSSSEEDERSKPSSSMKNRHREGWLSQANTVPSPSELYTFRCPYTLRKTERLRFMNQYWTIGDIVSLKGKSNKTIYAQIIELLVNELCEKRAKIIWLAPKANVGVTDASKLVHFDTFIPEEFAHIDIEDRLVPMDFLTFVRNVPNLFEYKKHIGTDYLVDTQIVQHAERYADSDDDEPKSRSKVRRLLDM